MKLSRNLVVNSAIVAAAVISSIAVYSTREAVTTGEHAERASNLFPVWREDEITRIEVKRPGERVVLEREPAKDGGEAAFKLSAPVQEPANTERAEKLLATLGFATPLRKLATASAADYGLASPRWEIAIQMGKLGYRLRIGNAATSPDGAAYAEVSRDGKTENVALLAKDLVGELDIRADGLRETRLLNYGASEVKELRLEQGGEAVRLTATTGGRFVLDPGPERADRDRIDLLFTELARLDAERFIDPAQAEAAQRGAEVVRLRVVPKEAASQPVELSIGGSCPDSDLTAVIRRAPSLRAACIRGSWLAKLRPTRSELVDRFAFSLRPDEVEELRLERGPAKLELVRKGNGFAMRLPSPADVELDAGNRRLSAIVRSQGELVEKPDLQKLGLDPPLARASVRSGAELTQNALEEKLAIGAPAPGGGVHVRREADGVVLVLPDEAARALTPDSTLLKGQQLFEFGQSSFVSIEIDMRGTRQRLRNGPGGNLELELPRGFRHDGQLAVDLVQALSALSVERWVADGNDGSFGLETPALTAQIAFKTGDGGVRNETLSVGRPANGDSYAKLDSDPGVFTLKRDVVDALETLLLDRSVFMIDPTSVAAIELESAGKRQNLTRRGTEFTSSDPGLDAARVRQILDGLDGLRAETALHTGAAKPEEGFEKPLLVVRTRPTGTEKPRTLRIGKGDSFRDTAVFYARADGVDATYVIAQSKVRQILDALGS